MAIEQHKCPKCGMHDWNNIIDDTMINQIAIRHHARTEFAVFCIKWQERYHFPPEVYTGLVLLMSAYVDSFGVSSSIKEG